MKRTLIEKINYDIPDDIKKIITGAKIYDSSSSPEARVYYIDKGYYLKTASHGSLACEAKMDAYFHKLGLGAEVLSYISADRDWLLTSRVIGEDCTNAQYLEQPEKLVPLLAQRLRMLHELDCRDCPVQNRIESYIKLAERNYYSNNYDKTAFPDSFGYRTAEEAYTVFKNGKEYLKNEVLIHGDYCLPNIILNDWNFSGFIDLGSGGIGDRHIDIFWGIWTLWFNLKTNKYASRFIDAYGRDKINTDMLRVVAAAEVFG